MLGIYLSVMWRAFVRRSDPIKRVSVEQLIFISLFFAFMMGMVVREILRYNY
jgi:hypothetical protein